MPSSRSLFSFDLVSTRRNEGYSSGATRIERVYNSGVWLQTKGKWQNLLTDYHGCDGLRWRRASTNTWCRPKLLQPPASWSWQRVFVETTKRSVATIIKGHVLCCRLLQRENETHIEISGRYVDQLEANFGRYIEGLQWSDNRWHGTEFLTR